MDDHHEIITTSAEETAGIGASLGRDLTGGGPGARVYCLYGDLGSGKTTFTQGFAKALGITTRLLSPTFIIVRRYDIPSSEKFLYHIDLYRLKNADDTEELGLTEILTNPESIVVIEWAEKLGDMMPVPRYDIHFGVRDDGSHTINLTRVTT